MKFVVVLALFAMTACSAFAAPSGLTLIGAPGVVATVPVATSSLVVGPSGLIASKEVAPATVGVVPVVVGYPGYGYGKYGYY